MRYSLGIGLRIVGMWIYRFLGAEMGFFGLNVMMMMRKRCYVGFGFVVVVRGMGCCSDVVVGGS